MVALDQQVECAAPPVERASVRFINPLDDAAWDRNVAQFAGANSFHSAAWCRVLKDTYGFVPLYAVAEMKGCITGVLPLIEVNNLPKGRRGVSLPFTDECRALGNETGVVEQLTGAVIDEGKRRRWNYAEFRGAPLSNGVAAISFYSHRVDLKSADKMFQKFDSSVQRAIRRAENSGVVVEITHTLEAVRAFYRLHERTRQKHGVPPQSFTFFENIQRHVLQAGQGFVVLARANDQVIAAAIFFHFSDRAIYKFGASDDRFQQLRANNLVFWKAIRALADRGAVELDFGRTSLDNEGLRRFKLGWGASESHLDYCKYDFRSERLVKDTDRAAGWHKHVFGMLPRTLCRWAGTLLYPRLA